MPCSSARRARGRMRSACGCARRVPPRATPSSRCTARRRTSGRGGVRPASRGCRGRLHLLDPST
eukprot:3927086-Prymnesium_polylepis.1